MKKDLAILLAVYNPREDWLIELLDSLNRQTYPHIHLYVRDDASPKYDFERLEEVVREHITAFPYTLMQNEKNLGSNQTFATLVGDCHEHYIAFCDQDDVMAAKGYMTVDKGSVCVNGVSLTVCNPTDDSFTVAIIPYTYEHTNFHTLKVGSVVNIEFDIIGKYIAQMLKR